MTKLLIANRGEIARRILRAGKERGYTVGVISTQDDLSSLVCREADAVVKVTSFLDAPNIVQKAQEWHADLIHPGYGFLSENAPFAALVEQAGIVFVGPTSENMKAMGSKVNAKKIALQHSIPTLPSLLFDELKKLPTEQWATELQKRKIFLPLLVKASGGGGGRGMRVVHDVADLPNTLQQASEEALSAFRDGTVFIERYLTHPRHIEIQVFGDGKGGGVFWGERECSLQRRHQKVIEEAPSSFVDVHLREQMGRASLELVKGTCYRGAGTVEFLVDEDRNFYFLEMNTRLQVEHPVTEEVYGIDLVHAQFDLAENKWPASFPNPNIFSLPQPKNVALEARILAEDSRNQFFPTPGKIHFYKEPVGEGIRVDTGVTTGSEINSNYDSMIAKLIVIAPTRALAVKKLTWALENFVILGFTTNLSFLRQISLHPDFLLGREYTSWIEAHLESLNRISLSPNLVTFLQSQKFIEKLLYVIERKNPVSKINKIFAKQNLSESNFFDIVPLSESYQYVLLSSGLTALQNSHPTPFFFSCDSSSPFNIHLSLHGEYLYLQRAVDFSNALDVGPQASEVRAPMPGKLYHVLVNVGDKVTENQTLFVVESMKMQLEVKAPQAGQIAQIFVKEGQLVSAAETLATLGSV